MADDTLAAKAVKKQRRVQDEVDRMDAERKLGAGDEKSPMQTGARAYPVPPFPAQHHPKPGDEGAVDPQPMYDAPYYLGSQKLDGMIALITGGDSGIGRSVAVLFAREAMD